MKNGDMPTNPCEIIPDKSTGLSKYYLGLSKREYFAGLAMSELIGSRGTESSYAAELSVKYADALLAELEKTK